MALLAWRVRPAVTAPVEPAVKFPEFIVNAHATPGRIDFINLDAWRRIEPGLDGPYDISRTPKFDQSSVAVFYLALQRQGILHA